MKHFPISPERLHAIRYELSEINLEPVPDYSGWAKGPRHNVEDGWIEGLANARIEMDQIWQYPSLLGEIIEHVTRIDAIMPCVTQVLVNRLAAGKRLSTHRDGAPWRERWHLVVETNPDVRWTDAIYGSLHMPLGWHGPVPYCGVAHSMANDGDADRLHVVIDIARLEQI